MNSKSRIFFWSLAGRDIPRRVICCGVVGVLSAPVEMMGAVISPPSNVGTSGNAAAGGVTPKPVRGWE